MRLLFIIFFFCNLLFAQNKATYSVKYKYELQKNPQEKKSIYTDIMGLDISKDSTNYFSYLRQIGLKNSKADIEAK